MSTWRRRKRRKARRDTENKTLIVVVIELRERSILGRVHICVDEDASKKSLQGLSKKI